MSHRVLDAALIARAGELAAKGIPPQEIGKGLGVTDRALYGWLKAAREGTGSELGRELLRVLAAGVGLPEQEP